MAALRNRALPTSTVSIGVNGQAVLASAGMLRRSTRRSESIVLTSANMRGNAA